MEISPDAEACEKRSGVALGFPAAEFGEERFEVPGLFAVFFRKVFLCVERFLLQSRSARAVDEHLNATSETGGVPPFDIERLHGLQRLDAEMRNDLILDERGIAFGRARRDGFGGLPLHEPFAQKFRHRDLARLDIGAIAGSVQEIVKLFNATLVNPPTAQS